MNRVLTTRLASLHFAATEGAAGNLIAEGIPRAANRGHRQLRHRRGPLRARRPRAGPSAGVWTGRNSTPPEKLILVTAHRRESFGEGFERICAALGAAGAARRRPDRLPGAPEPECSGARRPAPVGPGERLSGRSAGLRSLRGPHAPRLYPADRLRRRPGGRALSRQARPGHARQDRTPRGGRGRHRPAGRDATRTASSSRFPGCSTTARSTTAWLAFTTLTEMARRAAAFPT